MRVGWKELGLLLSLSCSLVVQSDLDPNKTHLIEFISDSVNDGFPLNPFIWNTTSDPILTLVFNYSTALINGRLLMILGKDPIEKDLSLFSIVFDHESGIFVADLQNTFGERLDMFNASVRDQVIPNANCKMDGNCTDPMLNIEQTVVLGLDDGDLRLMTYNRSKDTPIYSLYEILQLHVILGKSDARPGLIASGSFELHGVESAEPDANITILPVGGFGYSDKLTTLLQNGGISVPELLKKLNNEFLMLDEKSRLALTCMPHERSLCENSEFCVRPTNSSFFKCVCREGFAGKYCQFSLFPPTCTEALSSDPKRKPGIYQLDTDGSGPLRSTFAECLRDGRTIVTHNAPNRTQIREHNDTQHKYYPITYRLFSVLQLKGLKKRSARCEQTIRYECSGAPLDFKNKMTWFESEDKTNIYRLGSGASENGCLCASKNECQNNGLCNCESVESSSADTGTFFDAQAGIQMLYVKRHDSPGNANITIGPIECYGDSGHNPEKTWALKSREASILLGTQIGLRFFEMEFRTAQKNVPVLLRGDPIVEETKPENLTVSLIGGPIDMICNVSSDFLLCYQMTPFWRFNLRRLKLKCSGKEDDRFYNSLRLFSLDAAIDVFKYEGAEKSQTMQHVELDGLFFHRLKYFVDALKSRCPKLKSLKVNSYYTQTMDHLTLELLHIVRHNFQALKTVKDTCANWIASFDLDANLKYKLFDGENGAEYFEALKQIELASDAEFENIVGLGEAKYIITSKEKDTAINTSFSITTIHGPTAFVHN